MNDFIKNNFDKFKIEQIERAEKALSEKKRISIIIKNKKINRKRSLSVFYNSQYSYNIVNDKFILYCHGGRGHRIKIIGGQSTCIEHVVRKLRPLLKGRKELYISCCFPSEKRTIVDGVKVIPFYPSNEPVAVNMQLNSEKFICSNIEDFLKWEEEVLPFFEPEVFIVYDDNK